MQAPNTIISHAKCMAAIRACHGSKKGLCIFHANLELQMADISCIIRRFLSKFRTLKQDARAYDIGRSKATWI